MKTGVAPVVLLVALSSFSAALPADVSEPPESCGDQGKAWRTCAMSNVPSYMFQAFQTFPVSLDIDRACVDIQGLRNCFRALTTACPSYLTDRRLGWTYTFLESSISYVCSPEGRLTFTEILKSPCNRNISLVMDVHMSCYAEYFRTKKLFRELNQGQPTIRHRCQWIRERDSCNLGGYRSVCGQHAGDFVDRLFELYEATPGMFQQLTGYNCPQDQTQVEDVVSLIARGLDMFNTR